MIFAEHPVDVRRYDERHVRELVLDDGAETLVRKPGAELGAVDLRAHAGGDSGLHREAAVALLDELTLPELHGLVEHHRQAGRLARRHGLAEVQLLVRDFEHRGNTLGAEEGHDQAAVDTARPIRVDDEHRLVAGDRLYAELHRGRDVDGHAVGRCDVVRVNRWPVIG